MMDRTPAQANSTKAHDASAKPGESKPHALSEQIALLRNDLSGLADTVTGLAKEQFGDTIEGAQNAAADKAGELTAAIRSKPMQATAIAAGLGFVVGLLMTR